MRPVVVIYSAYPDLDEVMTAAALAGEFEALSATTLPDFSSQLYRNPESIGILWAFGAASAVETVRRIRLGNVENRLLVLLQEIEPAHVIAGYNAQVLMSGADDVQPVDIHPRELIARLKALSHRGAFVDPSRIVFLDCEYDLETQTLQSSRGKAHLTLTEGAILAFLARHPHKIINKTKILDAVYQIHRYRPDPQIINVFISKLRKKIVAVSDGWDVIDTVYGQGYRFDPEAFRVNPSVWSGSRRELREVARA